jgi:hypothetical protein
LISVLLFFSKNPGFLIFVSSITVEWEKSYILVGWIIQPKFKEHNRGTKSDNTSLQTSANKEAIIEKPQWMSDQKPLGVSLKLSS